MQTLWEYQKPVAFAVYTKYPHVSAVLHGNHFFYNFASGSYILLSKIAKKDTMKSVETFKRYSQYIRAKTLYANAHLGTFESPLRSMTVRDMAQWLERGALPMSLPAVRFRIPQDFQRNMMFLPSQYCDIFSRCCVLGQGTLP